MHRHLSAEFPSEAIWFWFEFPDKKKNKMHCVEQECCTWVKKEPPEPSMIGHQLLMWSCRGCLCLSVHHSGTCGFSYGMFYCSTMFLPWSSAHCIKTTLSPDAHTGRVCLIVHTCTRRVMMTSAKQWAHVDKGTLFPFDYNTLILHCPTLTHS